jgi:hypothetical protein
MSFLDDIINIKPNKNLGTMSHNRNIPQMHKDAEQLRHYYDDNALTVVSEEASTRHTVILGNNLSKKYSQIGGFPFESDITASPHPSSGNNTSHFKKGNGGFNYSQNSGGHSAISGGSGNQMTSSEMMFKMNRTKSAYLSPNPKNNNFGNTKAPRGSVQAKSMTEMDDIQEQSKNELSQESGNMIPKSPIMRVSSEGTQIPKRTFLPPNNELPDDNKNIFFGNLDPLRLEIEEHETNSIEDSIPMTSDSLYKKKKVWMDLPIIPEGPNYEITFLSGVTNKKDIHKKKAMVENMIFKLSDKGLFYDGGLSFGKLTGEGMLLLSMVDTSDLNSPEVKRNLLYKGGFSKNMVEGRGKIYFQNNGSFEGSFTKGIAHGAGKLVTSDGQVISGIWIEGKFNS